MNEDELVRLAEGVAAQRIVVENLGMVNQPSDTAERVRLDAQYMLANDKLRILQDRYQAALRQFVDGNPYRTHAT